MTNLFAAPVGKSGRILMAKAAEIFLSHGFECLFFVYDGSALEDPVFKDCRLIHDAGLKWELAIKYLTKDFTKDFTHIFYWDDDLDSAGFDPDLFLEIAARNDLELFQPALTPDSYFSWPITLQDKNYRFGRQTDFVEIMAPVFTNRAWTRFYDMMEKDSNFWGWGYDLGARVGAGIKRMGIIDATPVRHTRPINKARPEAVYERDKFLSSRNITPARRIVIAPLE